MSTADRFTELLGLRSPPVAVTFRAAPPDGLPRAAAPAPSGCTHWKRAAEGEAFILAGSRYTTVEELVGLIAEKAGVSPPSFRWPARPLYTAAALCEDVCRPLGIEPPLHRRRLDFYLKNRAFRIDKAKRILGWEPQVDLETGVSRTLDWYRKAGWI